MAALVPVESAIRITGSFERVVVPFSLAVFTMDVLSDGQRFDFSSERTPGCCASTKGAIAEHPNAASDNTAANLVLQTIGGPDGVTQFARSLGDTITRLDRKEPELNDWKPNDDRDTTSPSAMCQDLQRLLQTETLAKESRGRLAEWLQLNETGGTLIRAGIPAGWRVGDKTGRSRSGATNDVAVIYPPDGAPIFVAIYIFNSSSSDEKRSTTISSLGRVVCQAFHPDLLK